MKMPKGTLRRKIPVTAIYSHELEPILKKLRLYEPVKRGEVTCYFCKERLSLDKIGGLIEIEGEVQLICEKPECLGKAALLSAKRTSELFCS